MGARIERMGYVQVRFKNISFFCRFWPRILQGAIFWRDGSSRCPFGRLCSHIFRSIDTNLTSPGSILLPQRTSRTRYHVVPLSAKTKHQMVTISPKLWPFNHSTSVISSLVHLPSICSPDPLKISSVLRCFIGSRFVPSLQGKNRRWWPDENCSSEW